MSVVTRIDPMDFFPAELTARIFSMLEVDGQGRCKSLWLHWVGKLARLSNAWYSWIVQIMKDAKEAIPLFPPMLGAKEVGGKFTIRFGLRRCVQVRIGAITEYNPVDNRYVVEWLDVQLFDKNGVVLEPRRGRSRTGWMRSSEEREFHEGGHSWQALVRAPWQRGDGGGNATLLRASSGQCAATACTCAACGSYSLSDRGGSDVLERSDEPAQLQPE